MFISFGTAPPSEPRSWGAHITRSDIVSHIYCTMPIVRFALQLLYITLQVSLSTNTQHFEFNPEHFAGCMLDRAHSLPAAYAEKF